MKNVKYPSIRNELREREAHSRDIRKQIHAASGMDCWYLWTEKRSYGADTRHILLAYGFVRGLPYHVCEGKCGEGNGPSVSTIHAIVNAHKAVSLDDVRAWLAVEMAGKSSVAA